MILYLVAASCDGGVADAFSRDGWVRIGACRFATPEKHDVRVVWRAADLLPTPGVTLMFRGSDYDDGPGGPKDGVAVQAWQREHAEFERFIASGAGRWIGEEGVPAGAGAARVVGERREPRF